jgi:hypothetical protein
MKARQYAGLSILVIVALVIVAAQRAGGDGNDLKPLTIEGIVGGKLDFLNDEEVKKVLKDEYNLTVKATRVPSFEHVERCRPPLDFCWPSSQIAGDLILEALAPETISAQIIFNSPIVFYSWTPIVDELISQGIVEKVGETYYLNDVAKLVEMINNGNTWSDIGLAAPYGPMQIYTSDPAQSNTGNSFVGLLANTFNGGNVVDATTVNTVLPQVKTFVDRMGLLPSTTTQLFEQFLNLGMGAAPIIVAYESNLIEYSLLHPGADFHQKIRDDVRMLYPRPTVWSEQPMIPLTEGGKRFMEALRSPEIQRIGWERHGFRPGNPSTLIAVDNLAALGVPSSIDSAIRMPATNAMVTIMDALSTQAVMPPRRDNGYPQRV